MRLLVAVLLSIVSALVVNALPQASSDQDELEPILKQVPLHTTVLMARGAAASAATRAPLPGGSRDRFMDLWAGDYEKAFDGYESSRVEQKSGRS